MSYYSKRGGFYENPAPKKLFTKEHDYYWTPNDYWVDHNLKLRNLNLNHRELVQELARFYYYKTVRDKNYVDDDFLEEKVESFPEEQRVELYEKHAFYNELWEPFIPGWTPLEKALNLLEYLEKNQDPQEKKEGKKIHQINNLPKLLKQLPDREQFENTTLNTLLDHGKDMKDFNTRIKRLKKISLVESFGSSFAISKTITEKRVNNSIKHKIKRMVEYSDLVNSPLYQRMLPNFNAKLATKDLIVNMPIESKESKQKIIMLVDFSGSMSSRYKQDWVLTILADRLQYCMREECEIFFSFFLTTHEVKDNYFKFHHIYDEKTALKFFKEFNTNPSGGDTELGLVIDEIRKEIKENHKLFNLNIDLSKEKPEILAINDGDDTIKVNNFTWKTNAITIGQVNNQLKDLCEKNNGKYICLTDSNGDY